MSKKKNEPVDPSCMTPEELFKFEVAEELGLAGKVLEGGWRSLTSKESGRLGGVLARRLRERRKLTNPCD